MRAAKTGSVCVALVQKSTKSNRAANRCGAPNTIEKF
jgi:hypothetical protein